MLMKKLEGHVLNGEEMTNSQVRAAELLLRKVIPDLSAVTLEGGDPDKPLQTVTRVELVPLVNGKG